MLNAKVVFGFQRHFVSAFGLVARRPFALRPCFPSGNQASLAIAPDSERTTAASVVFHDLSHGVGQGLHGLLGKR